jgi:Ca2+-binding EF-hand superfamily protein
MEEYKLGKEDIASLSMVFHTFDEDGSGSIDMQEMLSVLK